MQCNSCSGEVAPKFAYAITQNVCPFCGEAIMEAELQKILASLHDAMAEAVKLSYTPLAIDWISSNFNLIEKDGEEFTALNTELATLQEDLKKADEEFLAAKKEIEKLKQELEEAKLAKHTKPIPKSGQAKTIQLGTDELGNEVQLQGESIQDPDTTQQFLKRAQVKPQNNNEHFKKIVSQIKKGGGSGGGGGAEVDMMAKVGSASPEEVEAWERAISAGSADIPMIQSGLDPDSFDEGLPPIIEAFAAGGQSASGTYNARDVARAQNLQNKAQARSNAMSGGGSVGLIRR